jgi:cytochrome c peroxidase
MSFRLLVCCVAVILCGSQLTVIAGEKVVLGEPSLTAGIPGTGPLTMDQIKGWLAKPENHLPLEIELPLGLKAGAANVFIPKDNPMTRAKIELGRQLFFDPRLSKGNEVSCADCHSPDNGYAKDTQFGVGVAGKTGDRNSPVSFNRILSERQFWDGRAASLEEQAVGPIQNPIEMANTHANAVATIAAIPGYKVQFENIFGRVPNIDDVGRAIATFERAIVTGPSAYDYYEPLRRFEENFAAELEDLESFKSDEPEQYAEYEKLRAAAEKAPMSESAKRGRALFFSEKSNCTACHVGVNFADEKYYNLGVGMDAAKPDVGRFKLSNADVDKGAFKTPTLRNITQSAPYMHDGSQKTLEEVVEWYAKGGHPNSGLSDKVKKLDLTAQDKSDLVAFMQSLTGPLPVVERKRLP